MACRCLKAIGNPGMLAIGALTSIHKDPREQPLKISGSNMPDREVPGRAARCVSRFQDLGGYGRESQEVR